MDMPYTILSRWAKATKEKRMPETVQYSLCPISVLLFSDGTAHYRTSTRWCEISGPCQPADGLKFFHQNHSPSYESFDIELGPRHHNRLVNHAVQIKIDFKLNIDVIEHSNENAGADITV